MPSAVAVAAILLFVGGGLPNWRVSPAISYHYMASKTSASQQYASSTYGLYLINFNGGASTKNWYRLQSLVCQAYSIQNSAGILVSGCGTECNGHYNTRCSVYVKLQTYGYLVRPHLDDLTTAFYKAVLCSCVADAWDGYCQWLSGATGCCLGFCFRRQSRRATGKKTAALILFKRKE